VTGKRGALGVGLAALACCLAGLQFFLAAVNHCFRHAYNLLREGAEAVGFGRWLFSFWHKSCGSASSRDTHYFRYNLGHYVARLYLLSLGLISVIVGPRCLAFTEHVPIFNFDSYQCSACAGSYLSQFFVGEIVPSETRDRLGGYILPSWRDNRDVLVPMVERRRR
jgi:hypothetical protein